MLQWRRKAYGLLHIGLTNNFIIDLAPVKYPLFYDNNGYVQLAGDVSSPGPYKMYGARVVTVHVPSLNVKGTVRKFGWLSFGGK